MYFNGTTPGSYAKIAGYSFPIINNINNSNSSIRDINQSIVLVENVPVDFVDVVLAYQSACQLLSHLVGLHQVTHPARSLARVVAHHA